MIKRSIFFSQPVYLRKRNNQLEAYLHDEVLTSAPIEDIGFLILENPQIHYSQNLVVALIENNTSIIYCNGKHMPCGIILNLNAHHLQHELHRTQTAITIPAQKALWKHIVQRKIDNQIRVIEMRKKEVPQIMRVSAREVKSDDSSNREAVAAKVYWKTIMPDGYSRANHNQLVNKLLNYGYAILRAAIARALSGSGLLPTIGIHHRNQYNTFALADDIMEPYRPFIDILAVSMASDPLACDTEIDREHKRQLLETLTVDAHFTDKKRPLVNAMSITTASLARYFENNKEKVLFPTVC